MIRSSVSSKVSVKDSSSLSRLDKSIDKSSSSLGETLYLRDISRMENNRSSTSCNTSPSKFKLDRWPNIFFVAPMIPLDAFSSNSIVTSRLSSEFFSNCVRFLNDSSIFFSTKP